MFEKVLVIFALLSLAGKFAFIPEAGIFFIISVTLLMIVYFPLGFFLFRPSRGSGQAPDETKTNRTKISLTNGAALAITLCGILFTLMLWQSGKFYLQIGIIFTSAVALFLQIRKSQTGKNTGLFIYYKRLVQRNVAVIAIALILYFIPTNTLIRFELRNDPKLAEMVIDCREKNGAGNCLQEIQAYRENEILKKLEERH